MTSIIMCLYLNLFIQLLLEEPVEVKRLVILVKVHLY